MPKRSEHKDPTTVTEPKTVRPKRRAMEDNPVEWTSPEDEAIAWHLYVLLQYIAEFGGEVVVKFAQPIPNPMLEDFTAS